jgi:hypothetical protein
MNMQQDLFTMLIEKYLGGKASRQELQLLEEYYTRLGRRSAQPLPGSEAAELKQIIFSELQGRMYGADKIKTTHIHFIQRKWLAVAVIFCIVAGTGIFFLLKENKKETGIAQVENRIAAINPVYYTLQNRKKNVLDTVLPDGTRVWLNENSSLTYPTAFAAGERKVELTGEAYFEVIHSATQPFKVKAGSELIEDLGTKFNVNAYAANGPVKITLIEGLLKVNNITLEPGHQYLNGNIMRVDAQASVKWINSFMEDEAVVFAKFPGEAQLAFEKYLTVASAPVKDLYLLNDTTLFTFVSKPNEGEYFFNEYSLNSKTVTDRYIKSPAGPGFTEVSFSGLYKKNTLWMHHFTAQYLFTSKIKNKNETVEPAVRSFSPNRFYYSIQLMDSLKIVATGSEHSENEIQETELAWSKETADYGTLPAAPSGIPFTAWKDANQTIIFLKPSEEKIVACSRYTDQIKIYDRQTHHRLVIKGPENFPPEFATMKATTDRFVMVRTPKTRIAFQSGAVTKKYIYLLYSGNLDEQRYVPDSKTRGAGKFIYVYDWSGNPIKKFNLDRFITGFTVSDDDSVIYATHRISDPKIIYKTKIIL